MRPERRPRHRRDVQALGCRADVASVRHESPRSIGLATPDCEIFAVVLETRDLRLSHRTAQIAGARDLCRNRPPFQYRARGEAVESRADRLTSLGDLRAATE